MRTGWMAAAVLAALGCSYKGTPVELVGSPTVAARLAGQWEGEYVGEESHRQGTIIFRITEHGDSAFGDVQMSLPWNAGYPKPVDGPEVHALHAPSAEFLAIRFVAIGGGQVSGELEPYIAPDCHCRVKTIFVGVPRGNTISGVYLTLTEQFAIQRGQWQVKRVEPAVGAGATPLTR